MPNEESLSDEFCFITSRGPNSGHDLEQLIVILIVTGMFLLIFVAAEMRSSEPFPNKWTSASVRCYSAFQAVLTEPLPSNGHIRHGM
jgi:hypothetical protein